MRCIFCLKERPGSEEHVFPLAIGGPLTTFRVCQECNSKLGSRVDAALSDNFLVRARRAELKLAGNSGTPPELHEILLGIAKIAGEQDQLVHTTFNESTGKLDLRSIPRATETVTSDGLKAIHFTVDEKDRGEIPKIIQRTRKRHGLLPLSPEEMAIEMEKYSEESIVSIQNPCIVIEREFSYAYLHQAIIKIAYELAFLWLGESYLDDPFAAELRAVVCKESPDSAEGLRGYFGSAEECDLLSRFWTLDKAHHLACAYVVAPHIAIAVRVFDIYAGVVFVSANARKYLTAPEDEKRLRFLAIDAVSGLMHDSSCSEEMKRIASAMGAAQCLPPFPDPLSMRQ